MRGLVAAVCLAALGVAGEARADTVRLKIDLDWRHVPRRDDVESKQVSRIPGGEIFYYRYASGLRVFSIEFADGHACATSAGKDALLTLQCGGLFALYDLIQEPHRQASLEWVTSGPARGQPPPSTPQEPAAKAEPDTAPKTRVRL